MGTFTQPSSEREYERVALRIHPDANMFLRVHVTNNGGVLIDTVDIIVPVSGPILDGTGAQLSASVPAAISSARASLLSAVDAAIDNAAAAGKFNR